ncbi:hypothetical protein CMI37_29310 [Candidatus Pacearchaeota archaeon]|jgi:hypothetical protein|nr:hypothetical protein [Candidatus Pacearchaeota archaeon]|tara:strand:+ start:1428 stop:1625 length:198 start_codon:yes stop_codon:yes gene_type:complete
MKEKDLSKVVESCIEQDGKYVLALKSGAYCALTEQYAACPYFDKSFKLTSGKLTVYACRIKDDNL